MLQIVKDACDLVGGAEALARRLGCTRQALSQWEKVPRGRVLEIEEITKRKITRHQMRPDLFRAKPPKAA
jgi:DNA-binding transcriptional regulator YdaS (Cro superfamily)